VVTFDEWAAGHTREELIAWAFERVLKQHAEAFDKLKDM
jgi:hypothetical protein